MNKKEFLNEFGTSSNNGICDLIPRYGGYWDNGNITNASSLVIMFYDLYSPEYGQYSRTWWLDEYYGEKGSPNKTRKEVLRHFKKFMIDTKMYKEL